jgi:hypothetical protein
MFKLPMRFSSAARAYIERYNPEGNEDDFRSLPSPETSGLLPCFLDLVS